MATQLDAICFDSDDPVALARFWAALLGWRPADDPWEGALVVPADGGTGFGLRFAPGRAAKTAQNRMHLELTSDSLEHQDATVARALALGARHVDVGQRPEEGHVVLGDTEGNEFCVIEPGNAFLAGCGFLGDVACDGTRAVGCFWSSALGWPLVWDQDEETAIQSPQGGPKITWGGPPLMPRTGGDRVHYDLTTAEADDVDGEVERLLALGATVVQDPGAEARTVVLADPDGNPFRLLASA